MNCGACRFELPDGTRFCSQCGHKQSPTGPNAGAERRQITVMFIDLADSTVLSELLDPEELREQLRSFQAVVSTAVDHYDGHIAQYLGDGVLVYFGEPKAHEDDARRAVLTALDILAGTQRMKRIPGTPRLTVRIGLHTGVGVVGDVGGDLRTERLAVGPVPNVAARIQSLAEPNTVYLSDATRGLLDDHFELSALGSHTLKGVSQGVELFRVERLRRAMGTLAPPSSTARSFVGRRAELERLEQAFGRSASGEGVAVVVSGGAGVGKSRLMHAMREQPRPGAARWLTCQGSPYGQSSVFHPLVQVVHNLFDLPENDSEASRAIIHERAGEFGLSQARDADVLAEFLSVADPTEAASQTPQELRKLTLSVLTRLFVELGRHGPLVLLVEDLHWVDHSTMAFLGSFIAAARGTAVLTLMTTRPDVAMNWPAGVEPELMHLTHLSEANARELVASFAGGEVLPEVVVRQIVERADGVPLFVEELTRTVLESPLFSAPATASGSLRSLTIPMTLRDSLTARLDRVGPAREVAKLAAVIGRSFSFELLATVCDGDRDNLRAALAKLQASEFLDADRDGEHFTFRHALIRDAAYQALLISRRREVHARIGEVLEAGHPEIVSAQPELLAQHFLGAERMARALDYFQLAGVMAMQRFAHHEALAQFEQAIEALETLPETTQRDTQELQLRALMGGSLIATAGYASEGVRHNYARAHELCTRASSNAEELFPVLYGLCVFHLARNLRAGVHEYTERLLDIAERSQRSEWLLHAHFADGQRKLFGGQLEPAEQAFRRAVEFYDPAAHRTLVRYYGDDHGLFARFYLAWTLQLQGREPETVAYHAETGRIVQELQDPLSDTIHRVFESMFCLERREPDRAREMNERALMDSRAHGFAFWSASAAIGLGWARARLEQAHDSIAQIEQGLGYYALIGHGVSVNGQAVLLDALLCLNQDEQAAALLDRITQRSSAEFSVFFDPELHRVRGQLHRRAGRTQLAMESFDRAIDLARSSGAGQFELRIAVDRAELLAETGHAPRARLALDDIALRFTAAPGTYEHRRAAGIRARLG